MNVIDNNLKTHIAERDLVVLRDRTTRMALAVAYTEEGLKLATYPNLRINNLRLPHGKSLYYKNGKLSRIYELKNDSFVPTKVIVTSDDNKDLEIADVIVEKFIPEDHTNLRLQLAEYAACDKGYRLLYSSWNNNLPTS